MRRSVCGPFICESEKLRLCIFLGAERHNSWRYPNILTCSEFEESGSKARSFPSRPGLRSLPSSLFAGSKLFIACRYMSPGSLLDISRYAFPDGFDEAVIATVLKQTLDGLMYLHQNGWLHRDVKAANLLVDGAFPVSLFEPGQTKSRTRRRRDCSPSRLWRLFLPLSRCIFLEPNSRDHRAPQRTHQPQVVRWHALLDGTRSCRTSIIRFQRWASRRLCYPARL